MAKHAGFRLVVFNMGLSLQARMYGRVKLSDSKVINELKKVLTNHVKKQPGFAWMNQVSSGVYQKALRDLRMLFIGIAHPSGPLPHSLVVEMVNLL
jgi:putative transposase